MELEAAKMIGAGLAVLALFGVGVGIGNIFSSLVSSLARNPSVRGTVFPARDARLRAGRSGGPVRPADRAHYSLRLLSTDAGKITA